MPRDPGPAAGPPGGHLLAGGPAGGGVQDDVVDAEIVEDDKK